jgi:hypothetical protein
MRVEQQNMFTGQFKVVRDDVAEAEQHQRCLEPFECPACQEDFIYPRWGEYYDEEEDKVYEYYFQYCWNCAFEQYVNQGDEDITEIIERPLRRTQAAKAAATLYDRRLVG